MSKHYRYCQPNSKDKKDDYGDCVVRSIATATGATWIDTFDILVERARQFQCMPNSKKAYEYVLCEHGFKYHGIKALKGSKRPTVESFAAEHSKGIYILQIAHHLVALVDGNYLDTWDCGESSLYGYYENILEIPWRTQYGKH